MLQLGLGLRRADQPAPVLAATMRRVRKDPIARLLAAATAAGVRFRISGAVLQVDGADALHPDDRSCLRRYIHDIRLRLEPPAPEVDLLDELGIDCVEVITDAERAREVLASLRGRGALGFDIETAPLERGDGPPWLKITKDGRLAAHQPKQQGDAGLDPLRAAPRLAQVYDPGAAMVYVIDLKHVPIALLGALEDVPLIVHNSAFEHMFLQVQGIHLRKAWCTLLMAFLVYGAERRRVRLANVAADLLGIDLPKTEQISDWGAERLSEAQLSYAAVDAVVAYRIAAKLWAGLDDGARAAFKLGNSTVPAVAAMKIAGIPFDRRIHEATIAGWERSYVEARDAFVAITGGDIPPAGAQRSAWLEARMPEDMLARWPRTPKNGLLRTRTADLERLAAVPEIRPLLEVLEKAKRLSAFGCTLLKKVGADGRLRMDLKPAATKTGRCSCSAPNLQQLPQDVRAAVVTRPGFTLVIADLNQVELRVAGELSGDEAMRQVFRDGKDMHRLNAEDFIGASLDTLLEAEQEIARNKAKRIGFGTLYGSGPRGLVASAWSMYRIEMTEAEALDWKSRFYARYPRLRQWQNETANVARATGVLRSVEGRPLKAEWEGGELRWTQCCNYPVQSSAADVMLRAMARVHATLDGFAARLLLQIHDELVVECVADEAPQVEALLRAHMTAAWTEVFPDAPTVGIVKIKTRPCWAKPEDE